MVHILYLEDDLPLATVVKRKLQSKGYLVDLVSDGVACLQKTLEVNYDILILDYTTPNLNGVEVLKELSLRASQPASIMVSGSKDLQIVIEAMRWGCSDFVVKEVGNYFELLAVSLNKVWDKVQLGKAKEFAEQQLNSSRENLQRAQQIAKIGNWEFFPGEKAARWSDQEFRNFGYQPNEVEATFDNYINKVHPEDRKFVETYEAECLAKKTGGNLIYRLLLDDNEIRYIRTVTEIDTNEKNEIVRIFGVSQDITQQKQYEARLKQAVTVFDTTSEAIFITDKDNVIISVNPAFCKITGYSEELVLNKTPDFLSSGYHSKSYFDELWTELKENGEWRGEIWSRHYDGHVFPTWQSITAITDEEGQIIQYVSIFSDISKRKESEELIRYQANYDGLTDLPNRNLFSDRLEREIKRAQRANTRIALMLLDLDRFKWINDTMGHRAGDLILQQTARRLENAVRTSDTVARLGGDEFTVILPELEKGVDAEVVAEKIFAAFEESVIIEGNEVFISSSIGISVFPEDGEDVETLQKNADSAMYSAKESGRNRFHYFTPLLQAEAERRLKLINFIHKAIEQDEFSVFYQPIVDIIENKIVSAEALIRWNQPEIGFISPAEFIPLAEETGSIRAIGDWVTQRVAEDMKRWHDLGIRPIKVSINKSPAQFSKGECNEEWISTFAKFDIPLSNVIVEITETVFMETGRSYIETLQHMKDAGIQVSLDDFGTGYSSLSYLKRFPVDILKIDREFINDLTVDPSDALLVDSILTLADKMQIRVVAEGVETEEQLQFLKRHNCRYVQGYFFSRPLPREEFEAYLNAFSVCTE